MDQVRRKVGELREKYEILRVDRTPIDVFTFLEIDLGLDAIPFDGLAQKYRVEASIKADFSGIYLDAEQYALMERGPDWKLNRLRFTVAHELAHYFLHRDLPQPENFSTLHDFAKWTDSHGGQKYTIEQEANEFAGLLLVPTERLAEYFDEFAREAENLLPNFVASGPLRDQFADKVAPRFGVNAQVIAVRLDRDSIWPAR
ncbi:MAG: Zn-dependent peptidase ImmA (M78 family) [Candidatus Binatia bacterium]|jgi:Zn-dependent peptidase ImmA (M78 family)